MRETQAIIERVRRISPQWQHLELAVEPELAHIQPGQFLLARIGDTWTPYLREAWLQLGYNPDEGVLVVERPLTERYTPGDEVSLIGPIGAPFALKRNSRHLLLVALDYPPTHLLALLLQALSEGMSVVLVLTGAAVDYPLANLPADVEVIQSQEVLAWPDQERTLMWAEQVFVVTQPFYCQEYYAHVWQMTQQVRRAVPEQFIHGVYTIPMPCGTGACFACLVRRKHQDHLACIQGPAFDLAHLSF